MTLKARATLTYCLGLLVGAYAHSGPSFVLVFGAAVLAAAFMNLIWPKAEERQSFGQKGTL